jgi:transcription initiation factor TFIID subunit 5
MAVTTPAATRSPDGATPPNPDATPSTSTIDRSVLEYLRSRGFHTAEQSLLKEIESPTPTNDKGKQPETSLSAVELLKQLAVSIESRLGDNVLKEPGIVLQTLSNMSNPTNIQNLISTIGAVGAEEMLSLDPTDRHEGFRELESWVEGSLDMYRVRRLS